MNMLRFLPGKKRPLQQQGTAVGAVGRPCTAAAGNNERAPGAPTAMTLDQQLRLPPPNQQTESREDGEEGEEEEEIREERQHTIDLQRSSRGLSNADEMALVQQRELRMQRNLSLPERHPRSSSSSLEYGLTDHEEDEDAEERSDRSDSIDQTAVPAVHRERSRRLVTPPPRACARGWMNAALWEEEGEEEGGAGAGGKQASVVGKTCMSPVLFFAPSPKFYRTYAYI
ncbi:unnamed protein product, partial [Ectocarpus fasciculatus]